MRNFETIISLTDVISDSVSDEYRTMAATRAAYRDGDVGFAFLFVLGEKKVDEPVNMIEKLSSRFVRVHVVDNSGMGTGMWFQIGHEIGIRQESHVKH